MQESKEYYASNALYYLFVTAVEFIEENPKTVMFLAALSGSALYNMYQQAQKTDFMSLSAELGMSKSLNRFITFFGSQERCKNKELMLARFNEYNALLFKTRDEAKAMHLAIIQKKQSGDVSDASDFYNKFAVDTSSYPDLDVDNACLAEIEQAIEARSKHHAKIKLSVENYLSSSCQKDDDSIQKQNLTLGV